MDLLKEYGIKEDSRFKAAAKEAKTIFIFWIIMMVWTFGWAFWGNAQDPATYSYILGFPTWYFWSCLGAGFVFPGIGILIALKLKDCPLDPYGKFEE